MAPCRAAAATLSSLLLASNVLSSMGAVHRVKMIKRSDEEFFKDKMEQARRQRIERYHTTLEVLLLPFVGGGFVCGVRGTADTARRVRGWFVPLISVGVRRFHMMGPSEVQHVV